MSPKIKIRIFQIFASIVGKEYSKKLLFILNKNLLKKSPLLFIHIPKAAGTSISNVLYGKRLGHFSYYDYKSYLPAKEFNKLTKFCVVRNPYARLVSSYEYAKSGGTADGGISNSSFYQNDEFKSFESFVKTWLINQDLSEVELVFRPQVEFLRIQKNSSEFHLENLFKLEDIESLEVFLSYQLENKIRLPHYNQNRKRLRFEEYYTEELRLIVYDLYKEDFMVFNYDENL